MKLGLHTEKSKTHDFDHSAVVHRHLKENQAHILVRLYHVCNAQVNCNYNLGRQAQESAVVQWSLPCHL